eukprot:gene3034-5950_t
MVRFYSAFVNSARASYIIRLNALKTALGGLRGPMNISQFTNRYSSTSSKSTRFSKLLKFTPRIIRVIRVGVLTFMVYQAGVQYGMVSYAKDPTRVEKELIFKILNVNESDDNLISTNSKIHTRVNNIAQRIITAARNHCDEELNKAIINQKSISSNINSIKFSNEDNSDIEFWKSAKKRLSGPWTLVLSKKDDINAFVTGLLPRTIFVHQGLLNILKPTDDELAMILSHELSHLILGHTHNQSEIALVLAMQLILMICIDPTGFLSLLFDYILGDIITIFFATHSRIHEIEADDLGIKISSKACYNTKTGVYILEKIAIHSSKHNYNKFLIVADDDDSESKESVVTSWTDTHPHPHSRYERLLLASEQLFLDINHGKFTTDCSLYQIEFEKASIASALATSSI